MRHRLSAVRSAETDKSSSLFEAAAAAANLGSACDVSTVSGNVSTEFLINDRKKPVYLYVLFFKKEKPQQKRTI